MGVSPAWVRPTFALPDRVLPDEHRVLTAFTLLDLKSHTRTNAPQAEKSKFDLRLYSMATTGPACDSKAVGPFGLFKSHSRTVRSVEIIMGFRSLSKRKLGIYWKIPAAAVYRLFSLTLTASTELLWPSTMCVQFMGLLTFGRPFNSRITPPGTGSWVPAPKRAKTSAAAASSRDTIRRKCCGDDCDSSFSLDNRCFSRVSE